MIAKRWPIVVIVAACLLGAPKLASAAVIAMGSINFANLAITPAARTLSFDGPWVLEAFAHTDNSLGAINDQFLSSISPDTISVSATLPSWAIASSTVSAPNNPANVVVSGSVLSNVSVPCCSAGAAFGQARSTLFNFFTISGTGSVAVDLSVNISGLLSAMTDSLGVFATTETNFHLDIDGAPVLFSNQALSIGPNDAQSLSFSTTLTNNIMLDAGIPHFVVVELETDPRANGKVPEPAVGLLLIPGLAALGAARRRRVLGQRKK